MEKTNVMRLLDAAKIPYGSYEYAAPDGALSGVEVARQLGQEEERVFKTLVTQAASGKYYVFVIPVGEELNLKKAASAVHEKKIEMIKSKELLPLTGYIHGGCSPIGMKKPFPTGGGRNGAALGHDYFQRWENRLSGGGIPGEFRKDDSLHLCGCDAGVREESHKPLLKGISGAAFWRWGRG